MKVSVRVSFRLESQNFDTLQEVIADVSRRIRSFADGWTRSGQIDSIEVRGSEIKQPEDPTAERER